MEERRLSEEQTARLIGRAGYSIAGFGVVLELDDLGGRDRLSGSPVYSIARL